MHDGALCATQCDILALVQDLDVDDVDMGCPMQISQIFIEIAGTQREGLTGSAKSGSSNVTCSIFGFHNLVQPPRPVSIVFARLIPPPWSGARIEARRSIIRVVGRCSPTSRCERTAPLEGEIAC